MKVKETRTGKHTKKWILETALKLFNEHGAQAISTKRIAKEMGISPGNLYYHFNNKEAIIRAIVQHKPRQFEIVWNNKQFSPLGKFLELIAEMLISWKEYYFFKRDLGIVLARDPELKSWYHTYKQEISQKIRALLQELIESGALRLPNDPTIADSLITISWLIAEHWFSYLDIDDKPLQENLQKGFELIIQVWRPYLMRDTLDQMYRLKDGMFSN